MFISSRGRIASLPEICRSGTPSAIAYAAGVLRNPAGIQELPQNFMEENAIPVLIGVFEVWDSNGARKFNGLLCNLAAREEGQIVKNCIF